MILRDSPLLPSQEPFKALHLKYSWSPKWIISPA